MSRASSSSSAGALSVLEELRSLPQVGALESSAHLDIVKEDYARSLGFVVRSGPVDGE
ncbi:hypothetical protein [Microbacterium sp.]|uniref:hypothetical protein n=1 Tax=Microbacterium sp. TaxID=51671 RepID=UPI003C722F08